MAYNYTGYSDPYSDQGYFYPPEEQGIAAGSSQHQDENYTDQPEPAYTYTEAPAYGHQTYHDNYYNGTHAAQQDEDSYNSYTNTNSQEQPQSYSSEQWQERVSSSDQWQENAATNQYQQYVSNAIDEKIGVSAVAGGSSAVAGTAAYGGVSAASGSTGPAASAGATVADNTVGLGSTSAGAAAAVAADQTSTQKVNDPNKMAVSTLQAQLLGSSSATQRDVETRDSRGPSAEDIALAEKFAEDINKQLYQVLPEAEVLQAKQSVVGRPVASAGSSGEGRAGNLLTKNDRNTTSTTDRGPTADDIALAQKFAGDIANGYEQQRGPSTADVELAAKFAAEIKAQQDKDGDMVQYYVEFFRL